MIMKLKKKFLPTFCLLLSIHSSLCETRDNSTKNITEHYLNSSDQEYRDKQNNSSEVIGGKNIQKEVTNETLDISSIISYTIFMKLNNYKNTKGHHPLIVTAVQKYENTSYDAVKEKVKLKTNMTVVDLINSKQNISGVLQETNQNLINLLETENSTSELEEFHNFTEINNRTSSTNESQHFLVNTTDIDEVENNQNFTLKNIIQLKTENSTFELEKFHNLTEINNKTSSSNESANFLVNSTNLDGVENITTIIGIFNRGQNETDDQWRPTETVRKAGVNDATAETTSTIFNYATKSTPLPVTNRSVDVNVTSEENSNKFTLHDTKNSYYVMFTFEDSVNWTDESLLDIENQIARISENKLENIKISSFESGSCANITWFNSMISYSKCGDDLKVRSMIEKFEHNDLNKKVKNIEIIFPEKCESFSNSYMKVILTACCTIFVSVFILFLLIKLHRHHSRKSKLNMVAFITRPTQPIILNGEFVNAGNINDKPRQPSVLRSEYQYQNQAFDNSERSNMIDDDKIKFESFQYKPDGL